MDSIKYQEKKVKCAVQTCVSYRLAGRRKFGFGKMAGDKKKGKGKATMKQRTEKSVKDTLHLLVESFQKVLYEEDTVFMENMKTRNLACDDIRKYQFWEWTQGVGLFGFWKYYERYRDRKYLDILEQYYERQFEIGLPSKNVNTVTPLLALSCYANTTQKEAYLKVCDEWAEWIMKEFPRTEEGGLQHITSDTLNEGELWDDTLFMTVLFLANMGCIRNRQDYKEEAIYQFLLHAKYLADPVSGLWYHGWTFRERSHFAGAFWGRGNSWITAAIPELLGMGICSREEERYLAGIFQNQVDALVRLQDESGMWHTLVDDADSYLEASATAGFAYGILRGIHLGILDQTYLETAQKALQAILACVTREGKVSQVSYGTPMGRESKEFYKKIPLQSMPYGQALAMLLLMEWESVEESKRETENRDSE